MNQLSPVKKRHKESSPPDARSQHASTSLAPAHAPPPQQVVAWLAHDADESERPPRSNRREMERANKVCPTSPRVSCTTVFTTVPLVLQQRQAIVIGDSPSPHRSASVIEISSDEEDSLYPNSKQ